MIVLGVTWLVIAGLAWLLPVGQLFICLIACLGALGCFGLARREHRQNRIEGIPRRKRIRRGKLQ